MSSDLPPGVIKGQFTFSPKPDVRPTDVAQAVRATLAKFAAPKTEVEVSAEYVPTR